MSTDGHTPLPWSQHKISESDEPFDVTDESGKTWVAMTVKFGSGETIVGEVSMRTTKAGYPYPVTEEETRANLALILRAVNSHDELLGAAKFILRGIESGHVKASPFLDFSDPDAEQLELKSPADLLRAAIARAGSAA